MDLLKDILDRNAITIDGIEVGYAVEQRPRRHRAYRNEIPDGRALDEQPVLQAQRPGDGVLES